MNLRVVASTHLLPILALAILLSTSLRPASKYLGSSLWAIPYAAVGLVILALISRSSFLQRRLLSKGFVWVVGAIFAALSAGFYQAADSLKETLQGQDQDDCTILVIRQLLAFDFPYDQTSYFGNPCSPLFGALIPYVPFVAIGLFFLANSVLLMLAIWLGFTLSDSSHGFSLTILISLAIPQTLELMVNGSDFVFMGFGLLVLAQLLQQAETKPKILIFATILTAALASSRVSMPILAVAYLIWILYRHRAKFVFQFFVLGVLSLGPSLIIYLINPDEFSPLHLVSKGQRLVPGTWYLLMIVATLVGFLVGGFLVSRNCNSVTFLTVSFAPHLLFLTYGDLVFNRQYDVSTWEGASYLMVITPLLADLISRWVLRSTSNAVLDTSRPSD